MCMLWKYKIYVITNLSPQSLIPIAYLYAKTRAKIYWNHAKSVEKVLVWAKEKPLKVAIFLESDVLTAVDGPSVMSLTVVRHAFQTFLLRLTGVKRQRLLLVIPWPTSWLGIAHHNSLKRSILCFFRCFLLFFVA